MAVPTLLVGLGGTGSAIVQRVYELATDEQRKGMGFVVLDTDVNELRVIKEKTPQIHTVQTSNRMTVGEYLDVDEFAKNNWFPVNRILNSKSLVDGAGQVRAISRLALNTSIVQGKMKPLDEAIEGLYELNDAEMIQAPKVILTGSLCGGTGSGLVLPVSMYIRNFMSTKLQQGSAIIRGFFLLPEVFDGVISSQSERNNLKSNAYAALRELDAFMMKDDGSLPEKFDLHFYAPRAGSAQPEEYTGRPMDFCFLFDAQNINGMKLNSFASYRAHAANCIYGMAVAPTSKRNNSSEDNVIREIIFAGGRNRYAGAGTSILKYPTDDVKRYLALCWTKESISDEWLAVDKEYLDRLQENAKARRGGAQVEKLDRGAHYIGVIDGGVSERKAFAIAIRSGAMQHNENGYGETGTNWDKYIEDLQSYITKRIDQQKEYLDEVINDVNRRASNTVENPVGANFRDWYASLIAYQNATYKNTEAVIGNIVYSLFKDTADYTKTTDSFRMEYWLHKDMDSLSFMHPNSVRYFLYNLIATLKSASKEQQGVVDSANEFWRGFEKATFKYETGGKSGEGTEMYDQDGYYEANYLNVESSAEKLLHHSAIGDATENLKGRFNAFKAKIDEYWEAYVNAEVYRAAIVYAEKLCEAFHGFYSVLNKTIRDVDVKINKMKEKYVVRPGEALRYVCADRTCLEKMQAEITNTGSGFDTPAELNRQIFDSMKKFALAERKPDDESVETYFLDTFNKSIVKYFEDQVMEQYKSDVDMDILTAIEKEAKYNDPKEYYGTEGQELYASKVITGMELLARPFIESPIGKEPRINKACAYSPDLDDPIKADFPGRAAFVARYLKDHGGVADESIDRNMILFYQAVYDLRANELSKFAPGRHEETFDSPDGDYYKAYFELISKINPDTNKSKAITPHIDKWWHIIDKLPDLDEKNQEMQEKRIYAAFFWGVVDQFVKMRSEKPGSFVYYLDRNKFKRDLSGDIMLRIASDAVRFEDRLMVSNGTACDHLYEILDAFTIYPALVTSVLGQADYSTIKHLYDKKPVKDSYLYNCLDILEISEFALGKDETAYRERMISVINQLKEEDEIKEKGISEILEEVLECFKINTGSKRSIFELPVIMKASVPAEKYFENNVISFLESMLELIKDYIKRFCTEKEFAYEYGELLKNQFKLFLKNITREGDKFPIRDIFHDSLFGFICGAVQSEFDNLGLINEAVLVKKLVNKLSSITV